MRELKNRKRKLPSLAFMTSLTLSLMGCDPAPQDSQTTARKPFPQTSIEYSPGPELEFLDETELTPRKSESQLDLENRVTGFDDLRPIWKHTFRGFNPHFLYLTKDNRYIATIGGNLFLMDRDGQLLTPGSHELRKDGDRIYLRTGACEETENTVPTELADVKGSHPENYFGKGKNGFLYLRREIN